MRKLIANNPAPFFTRSELEKETLESLLILLPNYWQITKEPNYWMISHMDAPQKTFDHPEQRAFSVKGYLIEFILSYPYDDDDIEVAMFGIRRKERQKQLN